MGQTNNLEKRIIQHKNKKGAKYIRYFTSFEHVYTETYKTRTKAMQREAHLKGWSKAKKEALIKGDNKSLTNLSKSTRLVEERLG